MTWGRVVQHELRGNRRFSQRGDFLLTLKQIFILKVVGPLVRSCWGSPMKMLVLVSKRSPHFSQSLCKNLHANEVAQLVQL